MNANITLSLKNVVGMQSQDSGFYLEMANSEPIKLFSKSDESIQVEENNIAQYLCSSFEGKDVETPESAIKQMIQQRMIAAFDAEKDRVKDILIKLQARPHSSMLDESGKPSILLRELDTLRVSVIESTLNGALFQSGGSDYIKDMVKEYTLLNQLMLEFDSFDTLISNLTQKLATILSEVDENTKERKHLLMNLNTYATQTSFKTCRIWVQGKSVDQIEKTFLKDVPDAKRRLCMKELSFEDLVKNIGICLN